MCIFNRASDGIKETEHVCSGERKEERHNTTGDDEGMPDQGQTEEVAGSTKGAE